MRLSTTLLILSLAGAPGSVSAQAPAIFSRCSVCHSMSGTNQIGPPLDGVVGRKAASAPGYSYSAAMKSVQGEWDRERLDRFLAKPQQFAPNNKMAFVGLNSPADRKVIIDYLTSSPKYSPK